MNKKEFPIFTGYSAGSHPKGFVPPVALRQIEAGKPFPVDLSLNILTVAVSNHWGRGRSIGRIGSAAASLPVRPFRNTFPLPCPRSFLS
jgi:hypothetical protein